MVESKYTAPHVTHHDEVDVTDPTSSRFGISSSPARKSREFG